MTPRNTRPALLATAFTALALAATACGSGPSSGSSADSSKASGGTGFPVTISVCGKDVTYDKAPTRAISNDINPFMDMAALGLEKSMIGTFGLAGFGPDGKTAVPTSYDTAYGEVKALSPKYIELEPLVGAKPDFVFAGWNYGFKVGTTLTPQTLEKYGIASYVLRESCAHVEDTKRRVTIADTYTDLTNLGKIFGVRDKAATVVADMKAEVAAVRAKVEDQPRKTVFLYDGGTDAPFTAPGLAMPDALIELAGGTNVFHDLKQTWTSVAWEQVVKRDPDCILVNDYGTPTYDEKVSFLRSSPITKDLRAVEAGCFIKSTYGDLTPSPGNADAVEAIARGLHPDVF